MVVYQFLFGTLILPLLIDDQDNLIKGPEKSPKKGPENKTDEIKKRRTDVFDLLKSDLKLSKPKIAKTLDLTERQVKDVFDYLVNNGYIHHEGSAKGGKWVIDRDFE